MMRTKKLIFAFLISFKTDVILVKTKIRDGTVTIRVPNMEL